LKKRGEHNCIMKKKNEWGPRGGEGAQHKHQAPVPTKGGVKNNEFLTRDTERGEKVRSRPDNDNTCQPDENLKKSERKENEAKHFHQERIRFNTTR